MKKIGIRLVILWICCSMLLPGISVHAVQTHMAEDISSRKLLTAAAGVNGVGMLFDGYLTDFAVLKQGAKLTLHHEDGIGSLYIRFGWEPKTYTVTDGESGESRSWGGQGILHEFLDLEKAFGRTLKTVTLSFENSTAHISEINAFTSGETPAYVQKWDPPADGAADIVLFSTHGDDEQLFFAGLIPYYARERGCQVQVVYMTDHRNMTLRRVGEMLDGLWAVGLRNYPVFGSFGDFPSATEEEALEIYGRKGICREDILEYVVENIRRFRPKVAVGHDLEGEYGHGMHMLYADVLCEAVEIANDPLQFSESAQTYGVWEVPKTYLHLYPENRVILDWDQPLESFDGMTAFQVTRDLGFPCHVSQLSYYSWYFAGMNSAADIAEFSPREFGLYRSTVGGDKAKNDFLENLTTHQQDKEEAERIEEIPTVQTEAEPETQATAAAPMEETAAQPEAPQTGKYASDITALAAGGLLLWLAAWITKRMGKRK